MNIFMIDIVFLKLGIIDKLAVFNFELFSAYDKIKTILWTQLMCPQLTYKNK